MDFVITNAANAANAANVTNVTNVVMEVTVLKIESSTSIIYYAIV